MARCWADDFQCTPAIQTQLLMRYRSLAKKTQVVSFFICRATCLWDVVGYFLGRLRSLPDARPVGLGAARIPRGLTVDFNHFK